MKRHTIRQFRRRLIVSGNVLEVYEYERPVARVWEVKRVGRSNAPFTSREVKDENRRKTARRARAYVRRVINANPQLNKFLTLTFAENCTDLYSARYEFDKFVKRIKTRFKRFQFVVVIEFQKRGAVHFHLLCNLPYVDVNALAAIWRYGFIKLNRIDNVDNVGAYVTKYMTKDNFDERLAGRKSYSMSKGLRKPKEYTDEKQIEEIVDNLESVKRVYSSEFESDYFGKISYMQIICTAPPPAPNPLRKFSERLKAFLTPLPDSTPCPFS